MPRRPLLPALPCALLLAACGGDPDAVGDPSDDPVVREADPQEAFWANLAQHCGNAYPGGLTLEPPGDEMLTGTEELLVHFRECGPDTLKLPFHIEREADGSWDRSRTWVFMRTEGGLELRHDHRHADGTPEETTWYGAETLGRGTSIRQEFILTERRAADGSALGWRVVVEPELRYTYGTIRGGEWTWRVDFDLTRPVDPPPAPWGHGTAGGG